MEGPTHDVRYEFFESEFKLLTIAFGIGTRGTG
jgi:hypothetical protein